MVKYFCIFLAGLLVSVSVSAKEKGNMVKMSYSPAKILGLWNFSQSIGGCGKRSSKTMRDIFDASRFKSDKAIRSQVTRLCEIRNSYFNQSYHFADFPDQRGEMGWDVAQHFDYQATQSKTLKEFKSRTVQVLPSAVLEELFQILNKLEPVYGSLIWTPNLPKLERYMKKLLAIWEQGKLSNAFQNVMMFYASNWDDSPVFTIHAYPVPGIKAHTTATVVHDSVVLEALLDEVDIAGRAGVIFHEMCHAAYEAQSLETQKNLDLWFKNSTSKFSGFAYSLLNEGLATALGNGMAYALIRGKEDPSDWYTVDEINKGAKAASSLVRRYVNEQKQIDQNFVNQWVEQYEKTFPTAFNRTDILIRESVLLTGGEQIKSSLAKVELRSQFRVDSLYTNSPIGSADSVKVFSEAPKNATLVIVLAPGQESQIKELVKVVPEVETAIAQLKKKDTPRVGLFYRGEHRAIAVLRMESPDAMKVAFAAFSKIKEIKEGAVTEFDF